jgi:hypothetical protein
MEARRAGVLTSAGGVQSLMSPYSAFVISNCDSIPAAVLAYNIACARGLGQNKAKRRQKGEGELTRGTRPSLKIICML